MPQQGAGFPAPCPEAMRYLILLALAPLCASAQDKPALRPDELIHLVRQDCGACHGMTLNGGLGSPLTKEALAGRSVDSLVATILQGRPGTPMPPWKTLLSEDEARWIAQQLLAGFPEDKPR